VQRAQHPIAVSVELGSVALDEAAIGVRIALASSLEELVLEHWWSHHPRR
jgi:hypothetical protein